MTLYVGESIRTLQAGINDEITWCIEGAFHSDDKSGVQVYEQVYAMPW